METFGIVSDFDVLSDIPAGMFTGGIDSPVDELVLQGTEERLGHGIIITDSGAADRLTQVERSKGGGELL